ncbi:MAG: hypothetical protein KIS66_06500 [Fimbriimonadaceae bacterium]|nr:hypothetical protein [Fimbriimonadaceae bacterium]
MSRTSARGDTDVKILDSFFGPYSENLRSAMGKATQRHSLLTANLANINTPGYKRKDMDFSIALEGEMRSESLLSRTNRGVRTDLGSVRVDGNSAVLEQEMVGIAETELRYQMLAEMTSRYFRGLKDTIKEGR